MDAPPKKRAGRWKLLMIVKVDEYGVSGSLKPDMTPLARTGRWE